MKKRVLEVMYNARIGSIIFSMELGKDQQADHVILEQVSRHKRKKDAFYRINDPLWSQVLMQDTLAVFDHGRIVHRMPELNLEVLSFDPQNIEVEETEEIICAITTTIENQQKK